MPKVTFLPSGKEVMVKAGETILDAALDNDIDLEHNCGGNCVCSTCHVVIEEGLETLKPPDEDELDMLEDVEEPFDGSRLSCQSIITEDLVVRIPAE